MALRTETLHSAADAAANGTVIDVKGRTGVALQVIGTFTGLKIVPEGSIMEKDWDGLAFVNLSTLAKVAAATGITAAGTYWVPTPGIRGFRARIDAITTGSVTIYAGATELPGPPV
jgi:hypothetical protein